MNLVKALVIYGSGLIITIFLILFIFLGLHELSNFALGLVSLQICFLLYVVIETILEIRSNGRKARAN